MAPGNGILGFVISRRFLAASKALFLLTYPGVTRPCAGSGWVTTGTVRVSCKPLGVQRDALPATRTMDARKTHVLER